MKTLQILPRLEIGGVEKTVVDLSSHFKEKMVVVCGGGRLAEEIKKQGASFYKLSVYKKSPLSLLSVRKLRKIISKEKVEIVHARSRVPAWVAFFATRNTSSHFVTTAHGKYRPHFFSQVMGWSKLVIAPSQTIARHLIENFKIDERKIRIVPRWVKLEDYKFLDPKTRLSYGTIVGIGRISPSKGWEYLIKAFYKLIRLNPYLKLKIAGSPSGKSDYFHYLKSLVNRLSLNYYVEFLGFKDSSSVLETASVLVVPSLVEEAFGRVVIEGFACGVPVVAFRCGALGEIIEHEKTGLLVPPKDVEKLKEEVLRILSDSRLAQKIAYNAYEEVKKYTFEKAVEKIEEVYRELKNMTNILVIKFSSLGDLILIIPSLKAIREKFPQANIHLLTLKKYASLFYECPYINKVIGVDSSYKKLKNIFRISFSLLKESYDYIIDFQNNLASHMIAFLSFPRYSFGYRRKLGFLLTKKIKWEKTSPLESQERLLSLLGIKIKEKKLCFWDLKERDFPAFLKKKKNLIGINVSAASGWQTKNWPLSHIEKLVKLLISSFPQYDVLLLGDKQALKITKDLKLEHPRLFNLCGKTTLKELVSLIKHLDVLVTPDSAPLHIGLALGIPTIGLFGPTNPSQHIEKNENFFLIFKKLSCSFCYRRKCRRRECMERISPQEVFKMIKKIISK